MSLIGMDAPTMERFNAFCTVVAARGEGLTLAQIGGAGALARELAKADPDIGKVESLQDRLGLKDSMRKC